MNGHTRRPRAARPIWRIRAHAPQRQQAEAHDGRQHPENDRQGRRDKGDEPGSAGAYRRRDPGSEEEEDRDEPEQAEDRDGERAGGCLAGAVRAQGVRDPGGAWPRRGNGTRPGALGRRGRAGERPLRARGAAWGSRSGGAADSSSISSGPMTTVPVIASGSTFRITSPTRTRSSGSREERSTRLPFTKTPLALPVSRMVRPWPTASITACRREHLGSEITMSQPGSRPSTTREPPRST